MAKIGYHELFVQCVVVLSHFFELYMYLVLWNCSKHIFTIAQINNQERTQSQVRHVNFTWFFKSAIGYMHSSQQFHYVSNEYKIHRFVA
jgi:hypothetical protein